MISKKRFILIGILILIYAVICDLYTNKVNAASFTLRQPNRVNARNHSNNNQTNIGSKSSVWWDLAFWEANGYIGHNSASLTYDLFSYQWDNYGLCNGQQMLIEGKIGALPVAGGTAGFFSNSGGKFDIYNNGSRMNCFYSFDNNDRISYSCSGVGGGSLIININWDNPTSYYHIGVSKNVNITCDVTQADIQNSINNLNTSINNQIANDNINTNNILNGNYQNTQQIINNNNNNTQSIINSNNQINSSITDTNNTLKDDNIDNPSSTTSQWANMNASNGTITTLLTLPISLMQAYVNGMNSSCSSFNLGSLFGTQIILPCINVGSLIGSTLWGIIDVLFSGFMIFGIAKKLIKIFNDFTNMKSNQVDELYGGGA